MRQLAVSAGISCLCLCAAIAVAGVNAADLLPPPVAQPMPPASAVSAPSAEKSGGSVPAPNVVPADPLRQKEDAEWSFNTFCKSDPVAALLDGIREADWQGQPSTVLVSTPVGYATRDGAASAVPAPGTPTLLAEYGCTHILTRRFLRPQRTVNVNIFSFRNDSGAFGAYSTMRTGSSNVVVRGDASSEDDNSISFWKGRRFVVIAATADEDDLSKQLVTRVADQLAAKIGEQGQTPELIYRLPVLDRVAGSERLFMGPNAARRHASVPRLNDLYIERARAAAFAEYQFRIPVAERMRVLLVDYGDPAFAQRIYAQYASALASSHKAQAVQANMQLCKLSDSYMLCSVSGPRLLIISGARKKISPLMLARQFTYY